MKALFRMFLSGTLAVAPLWGGGALAEPDPGMARAVGPCAAGQICRFEDPEDLADLTGTPWIIVSEATEGGHSGLAALQTRTDEILRFDGDIPGPACGAGMQGGGIGLRREGGGYRLVRILHAKDGGTDAVESLRITLTDGRPQLSRLACTPAPAPYFLNDIAPLPDGGFAATHMFDRTIPRPTLQAAFLAGTPTGFVVRWSPGAGWQRLPGTDGTFPNGIDASPDGRWLAFAEIYGHALNHIRIDGSERTRIPLAMQPDNVTALGGTRFLVAGGTGVPMVSTKRCPELKRPGCGFPAAATIVDFAKGSVTPLVTSHGDSTPGFSVAVRKAGKIYLGTAFGDRVTVVSPPTPASLP